MPILNDTTYSIYRIVCWVSCKVYVGLTNDPQRRKQEHFSLLKTGTHQNRHLQAAYNKHGWQSFYFEILEERIHSNEADDKEIYWIAHFDSFNHGYNQDKGGKGGEGNPRPCRWNNIDYPSIKAAACANGVTNTIMGWRIREGYSTDAEVPANGKSCSWNDILYDTISDAAMANGITKTSMSKRLANGYICDADMPGSTNHLDKICTWDGITYSSVSKAARANGVSRKTMEYRLTMGYTCDADMPGTSRACVWNGVLYPSIRQAAKALSIDLHTMQLRLKKGYACDSDMKRTGKSRAALKH